MQIGDKVQINHGPFTGVIVKPSALKIGYWVVRMLTSDRLVTYAPTSLTKVEN